MFFSVLALYAKAQEDPQFTQYMFNYVNVNPGFAGSNEMVCLNSIYRSQWVGIKGAPSNILFTGDMPFRLFEADHGVGLGFYTDKLGNYSDLSARLSYAYRTKVADGKMGIGISAGLYNSNVISDWRTVSTPSSGLFTAQTGKGSDPIIPDKGAANIYDIGLGVFYKTDRLYLGLSSTHINQLFSKAPLVYGSQLKTDASSLSPHFFASAGYKLPLSNPMFELAPSFLIQSDLKTNTFNINTNLIYNNRFWGGLSYRVGDAISAIIGLELFSGIKIGYSYDYTTSQLSNASSGSHELSVVYSFDIKKEKIPQRYKSIRFL